MQSFPAANNLVIEADDYSWRLSAQSEANMALIEASAAGVRYAAPFARARRLSEGGLIAPAQIAGVVVGWEADWWQLGFLFDGTLEAERGRWCGVARWYDPTADLYREIAYQSGKLLADLLARPFEFYPAATQPVATPETVSTSDQSLPHALLENTVELKLPIRVGEWVLTESRVGLAWERSASWQRAILLQALLFFGLAAVILLLAAGGLRSLFAPVQPEWLPLAGLIVTLATLIRGGYCAALLLTRSSLEFDERNRLIRVIRRPNGVIRQIPFEKIEYLLVNDVVSQHKAVRRLPNGVEEAISGETWIHLRRQQGDFLQVAYISAMDGHAALDLGQQPGQREPLDVRRVETPAHHAAQYLAQFMNIPAWEELRWSPRNTAKKPTPPALAAEAPQVETPVEQPLEQPVES